MKTNFNIEYSVDGITELLHRLNYSYKQTIILPANMDPEKQKEFVSKYNKLKENLKKTEKILHLDAVHPTHNTRTVKCWIKKGKEKQIKTNTGRDRLNINGAFDLEKTDVTTHFCKTVNSETTIELFDKIQEKYFDLEKVYLICDNARYYKSKMISEYLDNNPRLEMMFLPSYSPNLNFIERLWKYMKKEIIGTKFRPKFKEFEEDVGAFFNNFPDYKKEVKKFIGDEIHLIDYQPSLS